MMLGTWSMEVPSPWLRRPPTPFSRREMTAKPIIWAQHPAAAAPAARPLRSIMIHKAAELMGKVSTMPTTIQMCIRDSVQVALQRLVDIHRIHIGAGGHHFAGQLIIELKNRFDHILFRFVEDAMLLAAFDHGADLFLSLIHISRRR